MLVIYFLRNNQREWRCIALLCLCAVKIHVLLTRSLTRHPGIHRLCRLSEQTQKRIKDHGNCLMYHFTVFEFAKVISVILWLMHTLH